MVRPMRVLLSGFEPFGGESVNPSQRVVERLAATGVEGVVVPVEFERAWPLLAAEVERAEPDVVVALGQAAGASGVMVEGNAVNLDGPSFPDEAGHQPVDVPVVADAPLAYRTGLPVRALVDALREQGIPARPSRSAGGHLCNHVFYRLCHLAATERPGLVAGFVHLPYLPEQTLERDQPSMALAMQVAAVETVLETVAAGG